MLSNNLVSSIMTTDIPSLNVNATLKEAQSAFDYSHVRHLPVVENDEVIGMIGLSDIERVNAATDFCVENENVSASLFKNITVREVMSKEPVCIQKYQTIEEAAEILTERAFRALPVLDGDDIVGIISTTSLMEYLVQEVNANGVFI